MGSPNHVYKIILIESINKFNRLIENTEYENKKYIIDESKDYTEEQLQKIIIDLCKINKPLLTILTGWAIGEFFTDCCNDELNAGINTFSKITNLFDINADYDEL